MEFNDSQRRIIDSRCLVFGGYQRHEGQVTCTGPTLSVLSLSLSLALSMRSFTVSMQVRLLFEHQRYKF